MKTRLLILFLTLAFVGCTSAGKEYYDLAQNMYQQDKYEDAVKLYQTALESEPNNSQYKKALHDAKSAAADMYYKKAVQAFNTQPLTIHDIKIAEDSLNRALKYNPKHSDAASMLPEVEAQQQVALKQIQALYKLVLAALENDDYTAALAKLREIDAIFPNYEDTSNLRQKAIASGKKSYRKQGLEAFQQENFPDAVAAFSAYLALAPEDGKVIRMLNAAKKRDNIDFFIDKATEASNRGRYEEAYKSLSKAENIYGDSEKLQQQMKYVVKALQRDELAKCQRYATYGQIAMAMTTLNKLITMNPDLLMDETYYRLKNQVLTAAAQKAAAYTAEGKFGNAYYFYQAIKELNPSYQDIFYKIQNVTDKIKTRVRKSIAIMDFGSPADSPDAGKILSSSLTTYLFKVAGADIKILERSDIQPLLEEMNLTQAGVIDLKSMQNSKSLTGIDFFIFGSVLNYAVTTDEINGKRYAKYKIGTKNKQNKDYLNWKAKHPNPSEEQLRDAPEAYLEVPEFKEIQYDVTTMKKVAFVDIFYKMIDTGLAEILFTKTQKEKLPMSDDYVSGVKEAGIAHDPLEISTDMGLLQQLTTQQVSRMGTEILDRLQSLQIEYFRTGERMKERKEYEKAIEAFYNAIFDEQIKGMQTEISEKAAAEITNARVTLDRR